MAAALPVGGAFLIEDCVHDGILTPKELTEEHRAIARTAEEFWRKEVEPNLEGIQDQKPEVAVSVLRRAAELGLSATGVPENFGGINSEWHGSRSGCELLAA